MPDTLHSSLGAAIDVDEASDVVELDGALAVFGRRVTFGPPVDTSSQSNVSAARSEIDRDASLAIGGVLLPRGTMRLIPNPPFVGPRLSAWAFSDGKKVQVLWGIARDTMSVWSDATQVWFAGFDGRVWTQPELVMQGSPINWERRTASMVARGERIVVAAPTKDSAWSGILTAQRTAAGWNVQRVSVKNPLGALGVALGVSANRTFMFYGDWVARDTSIAMGMYVRELSPTGTWMVERLVTALPRGAINWPRAVTSADGTVHVLWLFSEDKGAPEIHHAFSRDGSAWQFDRLRLGSHPRDFTAAPDGAASVRVLVARQDIEAVSTSVWTAAGGFSALANLPFASSSPSLSVTLTRINRETLVMMWSQIATFTFGGQRVQWPVTMVARGTRRCREPMQVLEAGSQSSTSEGQHD